MATTQSGDSTHAIPRGLKIQRLS